MRLIIKFTNHLNLLLRVLMRLFLKTLTTPRDRPEAKDGNEWSLLRLTTKEKKEAYVKSFSFKFVSVLSNRANK